MRCEMKDKGGIAEEGMTNWGNCVVFRNQTIWMTLTICKSGVRPVMH